jgi:hypothetical protein
MHTSLTLPVYQLESVGNVDQGNPAGLVVRISRFGAVPSRRLNVDLVAGRTWAAGLWDFVWSCGSGFWSIAKLGAEAERAESSAASASRPSTPGL